MSRPSLPSRPRIIGATAHKYIGRNVAVIGEVTLISTAANSITLRLPDDETMIVLLQRGSSIPVNHLLTEVSGKLVARGTIEATWIKQFDQKQTSIFNHSQYLEAAKIWDAYYSYYDV